jgi:hypothetical protein
MARRQSSRPFRKTTTSNKESDMMDDEWPPDDGGSRRPMWEALDEELHRTVEDGGESMPMLRLIARRLAAKAAGGDISAIKEIFDRMDGKAVAGAAPDQDRPEKAILQWKDPQ